MELEFSERESCEYRALSTFSELFDDGETGRRSSAPASAGIIALPSDHHHHHRAVVLAPSEQLDANNNNVKTFDNDDAVAAISRAGGGVFDETAVVESPREQCFNTATTVDPNSAANICRIDGPPIDGIITSEVKSSAAAAARNDDDDDPVKSIQHGSDSLQSRQRIDTAGQPKPASQPEP